MNETDRVRSIITGIQRQYPKIYEALSALAKGLDKLDVNIDEVKSQLQTIPQIGLALAPNVEVFTYELIKKNVILRWEQPDPSIFAYDIKRGGTDWDTASHILRTSTTSAVFDPLPTGTTTYWIKGIDFDGSVSIDAKRLDVEVPAIGNMSLSASVIDNNVLFRWTEPNSVFDIAYYELYRDLTFLGKITGTFTTVFESIGGLFVYQIRPIDIAGNDGPYTTAQVEVRQPPDFDLLANSVDDLSGTKVNTLVYNGRLLCNVDTTKTWAEHFIEGDS
jgi:hypothetical protein